MVNGVAAFEYVLDVFTIAGISLLWFDLKEVIKKMYRTTAKVQLHLQNVTYVANQLNSLIDYCNEEHLHHEPPPYCES